MKAGKRESKQSRFTYHTPKHFSSLFLLTEACISQISSNRDLPMPLNCYNVPQNWSQHFSFFFFFSQLSRTSYPLCMRQLHTALKENHHLKHGGRLQYGLFLKVSCKHLPLCLRLKTNLTVKLPHKLVGILNIFEGDIFNFLGCFFSGHWSEFGRSTHLLEGRVHKTNGCGQGMSASWRTFCDLFNCWVIILFFSIWQPLSMYLCLG